MKSKTAGAVFGLVLLVCACFTSCDFVNPIMDRWWEEPRSVGGSYFTVEFEANGGTPAPGDQKIAMGGKVGKVPAMTRSGYGFGGWYKDEGLTQEWNLAEDTVNADVILYAKWVYPFYTVTFISNGGRPEPEKQNIAPGTKIFEPTAIRKSGPDPNTWLGFGGWYKDANFSDQWNFFTDTVNSDITLYARWTEPPELAHWYVAFDPDGGNPEPRPQDLMRGSRIVEPYAMNKDGFGFGGWFTEPGFVKQWNFAVDTVPDIGGTNYLILYAQWVTGYYTVTFNADGGVPAPRDQIVTHGTKITKPPVMRKSGQGFGGWFTDSSFTNEWDFDTPVTGNLNLYAKWGEEDFTVVFDSIIDNPPGLSGSQASSQHGNPVPENQYIIAGGKIHEPLDPSRAGFCFAGWYTKQTGGDPWDFDTQVTDDNLNSLNADVSGTTVTLYAYWVPEDPNMVWVRRGSFVMGDNSVSGAKPAHKVTINNGFYIGRYPVTQAEFNSVMMVSPAHANHFVASGDTAPVDSIFWDEAVDYCNKLTDDPTITGGAPSLILQRVYSGSGLSITADFTQNGYRLPTEAEWEYAARGGNGSPGNYIYAGSDNPDDVGWYNINSGSMTRPVGTKQPNGLGIYDMSGNIMEWCWDLYDANYYSVSPSNDPLGPSGTIGPASGLELRVRRGGSWNNAYGNIRTTIRNDFKQDSGARSEYWTLGFRIVRGPVNPPSYTGN